MQASFKHTPRNTTSTPAHSPQNFGIEPDMPPKCICIVQKHSTYIHLIQMSCIILWMHFSTGNEMSRSWWNAFFFFFYLWVLIKNQTGGSPVIFLNVFFLYAKDLYLVTFSMNNFPLSLFCIGLLLWSVLRQKWCVASPQSKKPN